MTADTPLPKQQKGILGILAIALGVGIIAIGIISTMNKDKVPQENIDQANSMVQYLQDKYGQEFTVENVRAEGTGLGVKGTWMADAYPKSDPSLKFEIGRSQTTGGINFDSFLQTLWTKQASGDVENFLSEQLPENDGYYLRVMAGSTNSDFYKSLQGETPSLTEMLEKHRDQLSYNLSVRAVSKLTTEEPASEQLNAAFKVINFAKELDIDDTSAGYAYRDPSFTEKDKSGQQEYQYRIRVERENLKNIQAATDLSKYFSELQ